MSDYPSSADELDDFIDDLCRRYPRKKTIKHQIVKALTAIQDAFYASIKGVKNLYIWLPIIWKDRWWDSAYLFDILEFKLRHMAHNFDKHDIHVGKERNVKYMLLCAELCKRISKEPYTFASGDHYFKRATKERCQLMMDARERDVTYLCLILKKHILGWWS